MDTPFLLSFVIYSIWILHLLYFSLESALLQSLCFRCVMVCPYSLPHHSTGSFGTSPSFSAKRRHSNISPNPIVNLFFSERNKK